MIWLTLILVAGLASPLMLRPGALTPVAGIAVWGSVLTLRATVAILATLALVVYVPATELFQQLTHWCLHGVVPFLSTHLGLSGHGIGDLAMLAPAALLAASLFSTGVGAWRGTRAVRRWLGNNRIGGIGEAVVVDDQEVVLAAAGLRRPQLVISAGALGALDEDELSAGLEHERGHIAHHHRWAFLLGGLLAALARPLPGTRHALSQFQLHLERDADEFAVRRTHNPLALASAICKAAAPPALATSLCGSETATRIRLLLDADEEGRPQFWLGRLSAVGWVVLTGAALVWAPAAMASGLSPFFAAAAGAGHLCA